jgi:hypothetical protein
MSRPPFRDLDAEFGRWFRASDMSLEDWIKCAGSLADLAAYGRIIWPDFVEHDGRVFKVDFSEPFYHETLLENGGDKEAAQALINHQHVLDLFGRPDARGKAPSQELVIYVGHLLQEIWQTKLNRDFPSRRVIVEFFPEHSENLDDYELTFYEQHPR